MDTYILTINYFDIHKDEVGFYAKNNITKKEYPLDAENLKEVREEVKIMDSGDCNG